MRQETIALHYGYTPDESAPTTAVPIYQSATFSSADAMVVPSISRPPVTSAV